ncbi:MAG: rhombosortase [Pseudomonadota bacterium]
MKNIQHYLVALILSLAVMAFLQLMPEWHDSLAFNSDNALSEGWPLVAAHFIHLDWSHALFNFAALAVIVLVWRQFFTTRWLINALLLSAVTTSLLLLLLPWEIEFVGLSAVLHGLLMYCVLKYVKQNRWVLILGVAVIGKVVAELLGWRPTHFIGDHVAYIHAAGLLSSLVLLKLERRRVSDAVPEPLKNTDSER